jgi:hypothetical protein
MKALLSRARKLLGPPRVNPEDCWPNGPGRVTCIYSDDEPPPEDPPRCPLCGMPHVQHIIEVVVHTRAEAEAYQARNLAAD